MESRRYRAAERRLSHAEGSDSPNGVSAEVARRGGIDEEHAGKDRRDQKDVSRVPADLLEEVFDLNMQLEEMQQAKKMGDTDPELQAVSNRRRRSLTACSMMSIATFAPVAGLGCGR